MAHVGLILTGQEDRYYLAQPLKSGGMGEVWDAWTIGQDDQLLPDEGSRVVVKIPRLDDSCRDREKCLQDFHRECQICRELPPHKNVVQFVDSGINSGIPFLVLEYIPGEPLMPYKPTFSMTLEEKYAAAEQLLRGIQHIHDHEMIHRDISPGNVLYWQDNEGNLHVKIVDFGFAIHTTDEQDGLVHGTPQYMSPEQLAGNPPVDVRTDLFSFGVMLHELCIGGKSPWHDLEKEDLFFHLLQFTDHAPGALRSLNPILYSLIRQLLENNRDQRPYCAEVALEVLKDARTYLPRARRAK